MWTRIGRLLYALCEALLIIKTTRLVFYVNTLTSLAYTAQLSVEVYASHLHYGTTPRRLQPFNNILARLYNLWWEIVRRE